MIASRVNHLHTCRVLACAVAKVGVSDGGRRRAGVGAAVAKDRAEKQVAAFPLGKFFEFVEILVRNLFQKSRDGGFREHRELRRIFLCQSVVGEQGFLEFFGPPLEVLGNVALQ